MPRALITGITGQDGLYMGELLVGKGYEVFGLVRGQSNPKAAEVERAIPTVSLLAGDLTDLSSLLAVLEVAQPSEVYNFGAVSFVGLSWKQPELTADVTGMGVLRLLEALRIHTQGRMEQVRFYQASSSEMFGIAPAPQSESTALHPRSPYAAAKAFGHHITINYRESYGAHACSGIAFNHESSRRGIEFVTRKITNGVARIVLGFQTHISLGVLDVERDWGFAGDYVEAMWRMLQRPEPDDYVIATGRGRSVRDLLTVAFSHVGIDDWSRHVRLDDRYRRPAEVPRLVGDAAKARDRLGWTPRVTFEQLVADMVDADLEREQAAAAARGAKSEPGDAPASAGRRSKVDREVAMARMRPIMGWFTEPEAELLVDVTERAIRELVGGAVVEVGSFYGRSTVLLASAVRDLRPDIPVVAIDPHNGVISVAGGPNQQCAPTFEAFCRNLTAAGVRDNVEIIQQPSTEVAWAQPIALLFIDGLHDYASVCSDFSHFERWLMPGGFVAFHDYSTNFPGVVQLVDELISRPALDRYGHVGDLVVLRAQPMPARQQPAAAVAAPVAGQQRQIACPDREGP